ncbi:hypothetical protein HKBW3S34_02438, partial [Candidatus Hakubella thermalkaliphila]
IYLRWRFYQKGEDRLTIGSSVLKSLQDVLLFLLDIQLDFSRLLFLGQASLFLSDGFRGRTFRPCFL